MDRRIGSVLLAAGVALQDRVTKIWIERSLRPGEVVPVVPGFFDIVHGSNRGVVFGLFADGEGPLWGLLVIGVPVIVMAGIGWLIWRLPASVAPCRRWGWAALGLIAGGALGNFHDRLVFGAVTDFLDVYVGSAHWPAFNVADSALTAGAALLLLEMLLAPRARKVS